MNIRAYLFSAYTTAIIGMLGRLSVADRVLPVFKNLWYDRLEGYESLGLDACGADIFKYQLLTYDDFMGSLPKYPNCTWDYDNPTMYFNSSSMPPAFINENSNDWKEIISDPSAAIVQYYEFACKNENGAYLYREDLYMSPFYDCPANTRLVIDETYHIICNDAPVSCIADVVARDLNIPGAEDCGHVGLVTSFLSYELNVLEVLSDPAGIFLTPLYGENNSFVSATKYWGERYGLVASPRLDFFVAEDIIKSGMDQMQYDFNYTVFYDYYPGGTDDHPNDCLFRCDSFILYAYLINGFLIKDSFYFPDSPKTIFNSFICSADPVGNCPTHYENQSLPAVLLNDVSSTGACAIFNISTVSQKTESEAAKIFRSLRPVFYSKSTQRLYLPSLIQKYQLLTDINLSVLFARCLCFELKKLIPEQIDNNIRELLVNYLLLYRDFIHDNFALSTLENRLGFYVANPYCQWLSAFLQQKQALCMRNISAWLVI